MAHDQKKPAQQMTGQEITEEQLHDVYMEGTSDGRIQLENKTIRIDDRKGD